ncbi:hypothetical protein MPC4_20265 [Methylocella tundrae]|uniref:Uncharacterized protein n=1 Tax=Methylocella tundrae TaxID=227605 RepID=A0A8B6M5E4_METTU|nr:hypothetical protein MPC4_20265 [Methylocella tundrae]
MSFGPHLLPLSVIVRAERNRTQRSPLSRRLREAPNFHIANDPSDAASTRFIDPIDRFTGTPYSIQLLPQAQLTPQTSAQRSRILARFVRWARPTARTRHHCRYRRRRHHDCSATRSISCRPDPGPISYEAPLADMTSNNTGLTLPPEIKDIRSLSRSEHRRVR